jgi:AraC-like DNA-binding protein
MIEENYKIKNKIVPLVVYCQKGNEDTNLHNHMDFEIILIKKGRARVQVSGQHYQVQAGDLIFINPMEIHSVTVDKQMDFEHACMCFDCSMILDDLLAEELKGEKQRVCHVVTSKDSGTDELVRWVEQIVECDRSNSPYMKMEMISYVSLLFVGLLKWGYVERYHKESKSVLFTARVLRYISENYSRQITSKEAAKVLGYDQSYFCRNFKKNFHACFSDHLNMYRVAVARTLLEEKSGTITQVAASCGFRTPAHFSACFRKYVGILPSDYKAGKKIK